ncbi:radical SAM protein [Tundrisphaera lichenicola]|uniref:radical SAM protein n=1 Tax=Tundrisphaera lichenicola TaxID=2029860 RepID=UPI003EC0CD96
MIQIVQPRPDRPIHVQIEVTWKCNWRCVHCYQDDHSLQVLNLERLRDLARELAEMGTMHVIVTGGEPLVRSDIFPILESFRAQGLGLTLYTNGHKVTDEVADRLAGLISTAEISVLAGDEAVHDLLARVPGAFRRTIRAIEELSRRGVDVLVKTPLLRPGYSTLKALEGRMQDLGVEWTVDPEISRSYSGEQFPLQYKLDFDEVRRFFADFPRFNPQAGYKPTTDPGVRLGMCLAARQFCFIDATGNVYPCLNFKSACDVREANGNEAAARLGNILDQPFGRIWESSPMARAIRAATVSDFATCGGCKAHEGCRPCMALNYEEHGELFRPSQIVCRQTQAAASLTDPTFIPASQLRPAR